MNQTDLRSSVEELLKAHQDLRSNLDRATLIAQALENKEANALPTGALYTHNPADSTGRIPKDTYVVDRKSVHKTVDWDSFNALPGDVFDSLVADALEVLKEKPFLYELDRSVGAESSSAMRVKTVTPLALGALFCDNMFRAVPKDIDQSMFPEEFLLVVVPEDFIPMEKYEGKINSEKIVAMDFEKKVGLVWGSRYGGCMKKLMFTAMNYALPEQGILPLHCSANEGAGDDVALYLGLSGTGKTTISSVPDRKLIGDDEHGWSDQGIANFENGCYAKLIRLREEKEPEIFAAVFGERPVLEHGAIIENAMVYPNGTVDVDDDRYTENSRASYPLTFLSNVKDGHTGTHPKTIIFLTADASGVLPPVAKLDAPRAMLWFLMGYTSKLAGTELGVTEPKAAFSRFFGAPFMPRHPSDYADLLGKKMEAHDVNVYLVNTGWSGGPYGTGERMDITVTRAVVAAALSGELENVEYREDERFHLPVPASCPGVDAGLLDPKSTWDDAKAYDEAAEKLAAQFAEHFQKDFAGKVDTAVAAVCPGS